MSVGSLWFSYPLLRSISPTSSRLTDRTAP